jgi:hypothetical protein
MIQPEHWQVAQAAVHCGQQDPLVSALAQLSVQGPLRAQGQVLTRLMSQAMAETRR